MAEVPTNNNTPEIVALDDVDSSTSVESSAASLKRPEKQLTTPPNDGSNENEPAVKRSRTTSDVWTSF
ncbi:hypothetical protein M5689_006517 [Euphorbia peplus]|nr:hypothetical protein M5689_006517 [Euphorbia peplus]